MGGIGYMLNIGAAYKHKLTIPSSNIAHCAHIDLSHMKTELWELPVLFTDGWPNKFT